MKAMKRRAAVAVALIFSVPLSSHAQTELKTIFSGTYEEAVEKYPDSIHLPLEVMQELAERGTQRTSEPRIALSVINQCSLLGDGETNWEEVLIPGPWYPANPLDWVLISYEVGGDDCNGRCGKGCPDGGGFPSCAGANGYYRYTTDCIVHDACVDRYALLDIRCVGIFPHSSDDCVQNGIDCCPGYDLHGHNFTDYPVEDYCDSDRCGPCSPGEGECTSSSECEGGSLCDAPRPSLCLCECTSGPCCTNGCDYDSDSTVCQTDADSDYGCPWGATCGADVGIQYRDRKCSGSSSSCNGLLGSWKGWTTADYCSATQTCANDDSTCNYSEPCEPCECILGTCCSNGCDFDSPGTSCGNAATDCSAQDTCNGSGTCLPNHSSVGAACGDQGVECRVNDTCNGSGTCTDNGVYAAGTMCGDASSTECTNPDTCDGGGNCNANDANGGTACGDPSNTECTDPDTCDGIGNCAANHSSGGAPCGDQGVTCLQNDACDGAGICLDSGFSALGTMCTDDGDACTKDWCDGAGTCANIPCTCEETQAGSKIAFTADQFGNSEVYVVNADGSSCSPTNITNNPADDDSPSWSPDGSKIAFSSDRDGNIEIYVVNADGSGGSPINITNHPAYDLDPSWSPDGSQIAFRSDRDGDYQIFVVNADGSSNSPASIFSGFTSADDWSWSPVASQISFRSGGIVYVVNVDGSNGSLTNITNDGVNSSWSPDGSRIVFLSDYVNEGSSFHYQIYVANADGSSSSPINISSGPASEEDYSWSPDSSQIAFPTDRDGGSREIYVADADGTGGSPTNLTNDPAWDSYPVWSPEGSQIAFLSDRTGSDQIFVVNVDGNGAPPTNVSNGPIGLFGDPEWSWSPDGSQIVFDSDRDGSSEIYVVDADGSNLMRLTNTVAFNTSDHWGPVWSRHLTPAPPTPSVPALSAGRTLALILLMAGIAIAAIFHHQREKVR